MWCKMCTVLRKKTFAGLCSVQECLLINPEMMRMMWPWAGGALNRKWVVGGCESGARCLSSVTRSTLIHCSFHSCFCWRHLQQWTSSSVYSTTADCLHVVTTAPHHSRLPILYTRMLYCTTTQFSTRLLIAEIDLADRTCLFDCSFVVLVIASENSPSA